MFYSHRVLSGLCPIKQDVPYIIQVKLPIRHLAGLAPVPLSPTQTSLSRPQFSCIWPASLHGHHPPTLAKRGKIDNGMHQEWTNRIVPRCLLSRLDWHHVCGCLVFYATRTAWLFTQVLGIAGERVSMSYATTPISLDDLVFGSSFSSFFSLEVPFYRITSP